MESSELINTINESLKNLYGIDTVTGDPIFRVVWSDDQYEKRLTDCTDTGIRLLHPEVRLLPKYKQWIPAKYILERLVLVPESSMQELPAQKQSYEVIWIFETQQGKYLPPKLEVAKIVVDALYAALGKTSMKKYVDPDAADPLEARKQRIDGIVKELFGNETDTGDALAYKEGVVVPSNYKG